ncbi:DNA polymerase zeta catalytic subunit isoform A [Alligator mississippiensis]|uniref:DNA polymerase n=1 Tax=Alligator mississippiensis TaxID=8496 RepID=A0A151MK15_ALLMI|nr:DNA polymerase zeta catalytic subunit isoform A [Alligator mississippiensis]
MFSVRLVTADYYMGSPLPGLDPCQPRCPQAPARRVPVVRVFGATPAGQKTCLHIHGIFPYLYVPYDGYGQQSEHYLRQVAFSIDRALNVALGNPSSTVQHVFKVSLVSGMPFYGYHEKERRFMKIYLYDPAMVKRVCELLQGGAIMNKSYQPHEAHIPYLLQLFIDYNLYGMNLINLAAVKFRKARRKSDVSSIIGCYKNWVPENSVMGTFFQWEEDEIPSSLMLEGVEPQSTCELEVDAVAADILNRLDIEAQIGRNPGLQAIWEDEKRRRREKNESSQISPPDSQEPNRRHGKEEEALINEEAILNVVENSQSFQPLSQRLNQTPVFMDTSADQAMIHLLAGLEDDGYQMRGHRTLPHHHSLGNFRNSQNSDDEENEPQVEKEEIELSLLMSQRWDSSIEEPGAKRRSVGKNLHRSSTEEEDSSSEEEMEWSGNSMLLANLSIPQLDGTADENGDNPLNNESSRTHSSVIATSKMSVKTSIFHKDAATLEPPSSAKITFQCKHTSALSSHVLNNEDLVEELSQPNTEARPELSVHPLTKESTYTAKYPMSFSNSAHSENSHKESNKKDILPVSSCENNIFEYEDDISSVSRQIPSRKYTSIRKVEKDSSYMHMSRHISDGILEKELMQSFLLLHHLTMPKLKTVTITIVIREEIMATLLDHDLAETIYQEPFCSNPSDAPEKPREIGGRLLTIETRLPNDLPEFEGDFSLEGLRLWKTAFSAMTQNPRPGSPPRNWQSVIDKRQINSHKTSEDKKIVIMPCKCAPSRQQVQTWLHAKEEYELMKKLPKDQPVEMEKGTENLSSTTLPSEKPVEITKTVVEDESLPNLQDRRPTGPTKDAPVSQISTTIIKTKETCDTHVNNIISTNYTIEPNKTPVESKTVATSTIEPDKEEEEEDYYINYSSPDSPVLPPWQQAASPDSSQSGFEDADWNSQDIVPSSVEEKDVTSAENEDTPVRAEGRTLLSTSPLLLKEGAGNLESFCLHSTPLVQRKHQEVIPDALDFTPLSTETKIHKLSQRRGSNADTLRRVLLTTQVKNQFALLNAPKKETSQIEGPSLNNSYGFKVSVQNLQEAKTLHEVQNLTLISMELHARPRRDLEPDPEFDPICALFYCISSDTALPNTDKKEITGAIVIDKDRTISSQGSRVQAPLLARSGVTGLEVTYTTDERTLFQEVVNIVKSYDPDILLGYEVQMHSWGYLLQRAAALSVDLCHMISRVPDDKKQNRFAPEQDEYGSEAMSEINIVGRIILNIWRMMRHEVNLTNYAFENVGFHVLHQRFPLFTSRVLSDWFDNKTDIYRWKMVDHYISRVRGNLQLLEQLDLIGRTSEMARLFGIQFLHVLTRGSQYRVESMMLRIAKPMNYIAVTPSIQQRAQMRPPQCVPLIMEPESRFYSNAVLVLDFQSLYPSIVIAYNYCFSTCLGHVENLGKYDEFKFGCTSLRVPPDLLYQIRHDITVSPSGVAFVKPSVRKGVLPRMLEEILKTRIMVKQSIKAHKHDRAIVRMLEARQLGLKLIANVTFGYTAANFSGRMPCVEIGDSIIHKARETLERAIKLVNDTKKWGARVVYGDTDSMFVLLKGATKEQSFKIGQEIAEAVTATNPNPVKLKFEKVYLPCVLQTKKRYVGYMYETLDQKDPVFDAKGIETVRRDSCPAVSKILERSIKLLFETRDISQIKQYVQNQCLKLLEGKASIQDFIFAKEYRGSFAYKPGACVPALEITRRMLAYDRCSEPRVGERVPYVIVYGMPGLPLIQLVRRPIEVLQDPNLRLNATYYITKQILPPLARIFSLIGIDVFSWYHELPRIQKAASTVHNELEVRKSTISQYFTTLHCPVCDELTQHGICSKCRSQPQRVAVILNQEIRELERKQEQLVTICKNCTGCFDRQIQCVSLNCPVLFKLSRVSRELSKAPYLRQLLDQF